MTPIDKCLQTLQVLVRAGDIKAIGLAEKAIDEFVAAHDGRDRQTDALNTLDRNLVLLRKRVSGLSVEFVDVVFDYIGKQFETYEKADEWTAPDKTWPIGRTYVRLSSLWQAALAQCFWRRPVQRTLNDQ